MQIFSHFPGRIPSPQICSDEPMLNARPTPGLWCSLMISGLPLQIPRSGVSFRALNCWKCFSCCSCFLRFCTRHHTAGKIPVAGTFSSAGSCRRNPQSESRLYHPADCHLRIQPGSRFFGRAEIRTFRLLKRAVAHAAATQTSVFRARP